MNAYIEDLKSLWERKQYISEYNHPIFIALLVDAIIASFFVSAIYVIVRWIVERG